MSDAAHFPRASLEEPAQQRADTPADVVKKSSRPLALTRVDDWLKTSFKKDLHEQAVEIMDAAVNHNISGLSNHRAIDPDIFVTRLGVHPLAGVAVLPTLISL